MPSITATLGDVTGPGGVPLADVALDITFEAHRERDERGPYTVIEWDPTDRYVKLEAYDPEGEIFLIDADLQSPEWIAFLAEHCEAIEDQCREEDNYQRREARRYTHRD